MKKSIFLLTLLAVFANIPMLAAQGDVFTAKTVEGIDMTFTVLDENKKTCSVGALRATAVDVATSGTVTIPETANGYKVTLIRANAFLNCTEITRVVIGNNVTLIGNSFVNCNKLSSVKFPDNEEFVIDGSFTVCPALTTITIPKNAKFYEDEYEGIVQTTVPFDRCMGLTEILTDEANPYYKSVNGVLFSKDGLRIMQYPAAKADSVYTIPVGTKIIDTGAFNCAQLNYLNIPNSVSEIRQIAFFGSHIKKLVLPEGLTEIPYRMANESFLTEGVTIPSTVTTIGEEAFRNTWMKRIELPESIKSIGENAFSNTPELKTVVSNIVNPFAIPDNTFDSYSTKTLYVPEGTLAKYQATDGWKNFTNIVDGSIGDTFTALTKEGVTMTFKIISKDDMTCQVGNGEEASVDVSTVGQVTIPETAKDYKVIAIGDKGFYNCASLTHIWLHENIERIGELAFYGCTSLRVLDIPRSVTYIADNAFDNCPNVVIGISFDRIGSLPADLPNKIGISEPNEEVRGELERVFIPRAVVTIGERTFSFCKAVKAMVVDENNTTFDSRESCNAIIRTADNTLLYGCQNTVIPESVTAIAQYAFEGHSNLKTIAIPAGVTAIGSAAFSGCSGLTTVTSAITAPFGIDDNTFDNEVYQTATLYVPEGTLAKYRAADGWKNFLNIEEKAMPADDGEIRELIPVAYFNDCENNGIPEGFTVDYQGTVRKPGSKYGNGSRMFRFAEGGDFTNGFYFREGFVLYGALEGYTMPLEKGALYYVLFNTAQWKSSGEWMKFEILNSQDEVVYTQMLKNEPNIDGRSDSKVTGSTAYEIQFVPDASDNYKLKWSSTNAAGTDVGFYEEVLANVQMFYSSGPGVWEATLLAEAMENAKAAREASRDSRYAGDVYTALDNLINQYGSAIPSTPAGRKQAAAELEAAAKAMINHHELCDTYDSLVEEARVIIENNADTKFAASPYYDELSIVFAKYAGKELKDDVALAIAVDELSAAVGMANDMFTYGHSIVSETGYAPLTDRLFFGVNALTSLDVSFNDPLVVQAVNALADDDELAAKLKQRVTMELYKRLADDEGSLPPACNVTVFLKNPNIYKISEGDSWKEGAVPGWDIPNGSGLTSGWSPHGSATVPVDAMLSNWGQAISASQTITDLPVGIYTVVAGFGERMNQETDPETYFYAVNSDNNLFRADCPYISQTFPSLNVEVRGIAVTDGKLTIGMKAAENTHVFFNNVQIIMTAPAEGYNYKAAYEKLKGAQTLEEIDDNEEISYGGNNSEINENTDLDGTVVGNILYNIAPDNGVYDPVEGCIEVTKATTDEEMDALEGKDIFGEDVRKHFTGIVLKVPAGKGTLTVNAETTGGMTLKVRIGGKETVELAIEGKAMMKVPYQVDEPTYIYIYGGEIGANASRSLANAATPTLKLYDIKVEQEPAIKGDINGDGKVNVGDIMAVINIMASKVD